MIKIIIITSLGILFLYASFSFTNESSASKDTIVLGALFEILNLYHYSPATIDDSFSEKAYKTYLKQIDYDKMFLNQHDVDILDTYKHSIDDELKNKTFDLFDLSVEIITNKIELIKKSYVQFLQNPINFSIDEKYETADDKRGYAKNDSLLLDNWRKSIKLQVLETINELKEDQEKLKSKNDTVTLKTFDELEKTARTKIKKRLDERFKRYNKITNEDRMSLFINALTNVFDPHTDYFAPQKKEDFDIQMSGKLEGIGATLSEKDGSIKVENIVPGSASWKQGQLQAGDYILKVAQGDEEPVDIVDMRLDEAVRLIRGPKGTKVVLTVKKIDGNIITIPIIRDVVIIEETFAKSSILADENSKSKIGYIYLPEFYIDFNDSHGRKCSEDVLQEITKLKNDGVTGIIFDLRNNGGGSLNDAVKIGGYFIPSGPIVQVKSRGQAPQVMGDNDNKTYFDGPLIIMVNKNSASASEIVTAAMQDYHRAIIVGSESSYGKGTVQRFVDLDSYVPKDFDKYKPLGQTKITIQKFYRINGGATQIKGVIPDIVLPNKYKYFEMGEKDQDNPMKWDTIAPVPYNVLNYNANIAKLKKADEKRVSKDTTFQKIEQAANFLNEQKKNTVYPLNYTAFVERKAVDKQNYSRFNSLGKSETGLKVMPSEVIQQVTSLDSIHVKRLENWHKELKKDPELFETFKIMQDIIKK